MLSRALMRAAQSPALRTTAMRTARVSIPASTIWMRGMAKNRHRDRGQQREGSGQQQSQANSVQSNPQSTKLHAATEAETKAAPENTTPQDEGAQKSSVEETPAQKPFNLPDLTQGIPSTLQYETEGSTNRSALAELEPQSGTEGGGRGKGELPASAYISSTDKRRNWWANALYLSSAGLGVLSIAYLGRDWNEDEAKAHEDIPNGWTPGLWWKRAMARQGDLLSYYREPAFEKLLPDPDPMFERPYTLCISLEDMLVHSEWTREHGWRVAKRPGADYFLHYLSQYYELVLFTSVPFAMGDPIIRKLDPYRFIVWPLYREATKYKDGETVKDLSYLNRDLSKVIIIDTNASHVRNQPQNAIVLPKWTGDPKDQELVSLVPFLEYIHTMQYKDVREVLKSFEGKHIPTEFARREAIARAEFQKRYQQQKPKRGSGVGALGNMLGLKPSNMSMMVPLDGEQTQMEAFSQGKMLQDIARERGRRNYELMEEEIRKNGEKWLKEEQAMVEKMQAEAMQNMKQGFMKQGLSGWFGPKNEESQEEAKK